ncbi:hypothetical protein NQ315_015089 [Exocentrus adspersus]|uniref:Uncharacterized protein n=1 Tax=Exocentrus adspersus TaxID=1586481 RepID=A0AAV8VX50_9CUCU|nr:hypothetical protein NQ315_015089 [Exocentrus adspersus]
MYATYTGGGPPSLRAASNISSDSSTAPTTTPSHASTTCCNGSGCEPSGTLPKKTKMATSSFIDSTFTIFGIKYKNSCCCDGSSRLRQGFGCYRSEGKICFGNIRVFGKDPMAFAIYHSYCLNRIRGEGECSPIR